MQLIDVDVLLEQMEKLYQKRSEESNMTGDRAVCVTWNDAVFCIKDSSIIDAVPVVRCKDCRNWDTSWKPHSYEPLCPRYYCAITDLVTTGDWFCADGERKDDDKNLAKITEHSMEG